MKKHILFSFRRCPFAIRARWAIKMCGIEVELREISLKNKPLDLIKNSISQTVPLLILNNGEVIEESLDIIIWALQNSKYNYAERYFKQNDQQLILETIQENDQLFKYHLDRFKYSSRFNSNEKKFHFIMAENFIKKWNNFLCESTNNKFLIGDQESIADWSIWPFVRQFKIACDSQNIFNYFEEPLVFWYDYFSKHENYKYVMYKYNIWKPSSVQETFPKNLDF